MSANLQQLNLKFFGPCHFSEIEKIIAGELEDKPKPSSNYGIYIFGFVYECDDEGNLTNPKDCSDFKSYQINKEKPGIKFIPYYVGKDSNINSFNRIKEHHNPFGTISKTIRFTAEHMKEFYLGKHNMPIHYDNSKKYNNAINDWSKADRFSYFNDIDVMKKIYGNDYSIKKVYPLNNKHYTDFEKHDNFYLLKKQDKAGNFSNIEDTLGELIINNDNFWFSYAAIEEEHLDLLGDLGTQIDYKINSKKEKKVINLEILETIVFWALKGMTVSSISGSLDIEKINKLKDKIYLNFDKKLESIFKYQENKWEIHKEEYSNKEIFPGYK